MDPPAPVIRITLPLTFGPKSFLSASTVSLPNKSLIDTGFRESIVADLKQVVQLKD